ncbi:MAG: hypothetical protein M1832_002494 [Thelocarpon impressellum]|nr:MAG: hypothetical protein M1832_002494 [Thelocarpon impressellum]
MLHQITHCNLSVELFGEHHAGPILVAPFGVQSIFHADRELGVAEVAAEIGVPYVLSTAASSTIEDMAMANGQGARWFQLYWPHDDDITLSLLDRPAQAGFSVLVVTLDAWVLGWRSAD